MDPGYRTPFIDLFLRGDVERAIRLLAARGALALRAHEQLSLLLILLDDTDSEIAQQAEATIASLPEAAVTAFLARPDVPESLRAFFAARDVHPSATATVRDTNDDLAEPLLDTSGDSGGTEDEDQAGVPDALLSSLPVIDRLKLATKGTREQRARLIRDSNRMVATAVLSSPKVNESEVEAFARMANVSEDVLRIIGAKRSWMKHYAVAHGLVRNPKTPPGISMQLLHRLTDRDVKSVAVDRNVPEALRLAARRMMLRSQK
jgi:hypothetical protein